MSLCTCASDRKWLKGGGINTKLYQREFCQNCVFSFNYANASNTLKKNQPFNLQKLTLKEKHAFYLCTHRTRHIISLLTWTLEEYIKKKKTGLKRQFKQCIKPKHFSQWWQAFTSQSLINNSTDLKSIPKAVLTDAKLLHTQTETD